ncbi:MAG: hypothetical protein ACOC7R_02230 [Planctomycetota bacterium]
MTTLENNKLRLVASDDRVVIEDRLRRCAWIWRSRDAEFTCSSGTAPQHLRRPTVTAADETVEVCFDVDGGRVRYAWSLRDDYAKVRLACDAPDVEAASLPGPVAAAEGTAWAAVPVYQGLLLRGSVHRWRRRVRHGGHEGFSIATGALLGERGGLLVAHESPANWRAWYGQYDGGPGFHFEHLRCPADGWVDAAVRLTPVDADLTAACKRYRRRIIERGPFVTWSEKIERKPIVKDLFGAMMAFIGYNRDDAIDYVAGAKALAKRGFDSVFYYPVRMCSYSLGFLMGGDEPIWLSDAQLDAMHAVPGAHLAPWGWVYEGLDDGSDVMRSIFRHHASGPEKGWKIDDFQWYCVCTPYQVEHIRKRFTTDMRAMDWIHYDVNATIAGRPCLADDHAAHGNAPMGRRDDIEWIRTLFGGGTVGNRVVSSEGFGDHFAGHYDIGSTKCLPLWDGAANTVPVPMTMLVFHDSCIHDWWEVHNYNANPGFPIADLPEGIARAGSGLPALKAAMDALYGCPPNVFPFGRQYGWVDKPGGRSYAFTMSLDDPGVAEALDCALPVTRLHKRIGTCELTTWESLSDDDTVQRTTFSDGTRVVANLSDEPREAPDVGRMEGHTWETLD